MLSNAAFFWHVGSIKKVRQFQTKSGYPKETFSTFFWFVTTFLFLFLAHRFPLLIKMPYKILKIGGFGRLCTLAFFLVFYVHGFGIELVSKPGRQQHCRKM